MLELATVERFQLRPARLQRAEQALAVAHDAPRVRRALDHVARALLLEPVEPVVAAAAINLADVDDHDRDVVGALEDLRDQPLTLVVRVGPGERLGVGDAGAGQPGGLARAQGDARHHHRPEDRPAPCFVDAEDELVVDEGRRHYESESSAIVELFDRGNESLLDLQPIELDGGAQPPQP